LLQNCRELALEKGQSLANRSTTMRIQTRLPFAAVAVCVAALTFAVTALADETHDTAPAPKTVTVTVKAGWHVNKEYPWKLVSNGNKLDKTHFALTETSAVISDAPPGPAKLKGAVCSGDQCKTFEEDVIIP
jgi:hypothetical protein